MMNSKTIFTIAFIILASGLEAQPWLQDIDLKKSADQGGEFYLIQDAFNEYWKDKKIEKSRGWHQFKRWEHFMEPRVYPQGNLDLPPYFTLLNKQENLQADLASWSPLGPYVVPPVAYADRMSGAGRINAIAFHPTNKNIMYAGAPSGGLWKTINGGTTWTSLGDQFASLGVSDIAINPVNPDIIYIATGDGDSGDTYGSGILKSTDGGASWNPTQFSLELNETYYFRRIIINPDNPEVLFTTTNKGLYFTDDGFNTYTQLRPGHFKDLEFHPGNPLIVYATEYDSGGKSKIIRVKNNGLDIKVLFSGLDLTDNANRVELAVTPAQPDAVFALASSSRNSSFYALYKSENQGDTWTKIYDDDGFNLLGWDLDGGDSRGQGWYDLSLAVDPANKDIIFVGGVNIWKSVNGGGSFSINAHWIGLDEIDYVHADHHMLVYSPVTGELFSCNDGGIYKTANKGTDWTDLSNSLSILQVYKTSASQTNRDLFLTGNQDNGSFMSKNGEWSEVTGGDGMDCLVKADNPDYLVTSYYYGSFWLSRDGGETFYAFGPGKERGTGAWVTPLVPSEKNPDHVFVAYENVYKTEDFGQTWIQLSDSLTTRINFRSLAVSPSDENYIYVSTYSESFRTRNGGITWESISDGLPDLAIMSVAVSPNNPEKIWLSLSGFDEGEKVYMSENAGDSWTNFSQGLPNIPTNFIRSIPGSNGALYLGTDVGIYYRDQSMSEWVSYNNGLPNVIVNDIESQANFDRLVIATYGRGIWESTYYPLPVNTISGEIITLNRYSCVHENAVFTIELLNPADSIRWDFNKEFELSADPSDTVEVSFDMPGKKNIRATIYSEGSSETVELKNYFEVRESVELLVGSTDITDYHPQDPGTLFAAGANEYEWTTSSEFTISDPYSSSINISLLDTSTFYVTGRIGSCETTDSITVNVIPGPENDRICNALPLNYGINGPFTNVDASTEINEPLPDTSDCNTQYTWCNESGLQATVWFTYEAQASLTSFITEGFDTQIAVYEAEGCDAILNGEYTLVAANDDYFGKTKDYAAAIDYANLVPGKTYWVQIDGSAGGEEGEFNIMIYHSPVRIEEITGSEDTNPVIYPNPSTGTFNLEYFATGKSRIEVYDLNGRKRLDKTINIPGSVEESISLAGSGVYILRISTDDRIYNRKLIVE